MLRSLIKLDGGWIKISEFVEASAEQILSVVREQRLEGIIGKQRDSVYEPGKRSGAWIKHRVNLGQEFVIGGFTPGPHGLDAVIVGYYRGDELIYVARTRNGFVAASRRRVFETLTEAQESIEAWRQEYNESRPHRALGERTPNEFAKRILARRDSFGPQTAENSP